MIKLRSKQATSAGCLKESLCLLLNATNFFRISTPFVGGFLLLLTTHAYDLTSVVWRDDALVSALK